MKAKTSSHLSKWIAALMIIAGTILKGLGVLRDLTIMDIITPSIAIACIFSTIDINLMFDKLTALKGGAPLTTIFQGNIPPKQGVENVVEPQRPGNKP